MLAAGVDRREKDALAKSLDAQRADDATAAVAGSSDPVSFPEAKQLGIRLGRSLWETAAVDSFLRPIVAVGAAAGTSGSSTVPDIASLEATSNALRQRLAALRSLDRNF